MRSDARFCAVRSDARIERAERRPTGPSEEAIQVKTKADNRNERPGKQLPHDVREKQYPTKNRDKRETYLDVTRVTKRRYKAQLQSVSPKSLGEKVLAENDACVLGISLGNRSMERAKLEACIEWVSNNFKECALNITDTLYRYTLQITQGVPSDKCRDEAILAGEKFQTEYGPLIDKYSKNCRFQWLRVSEIEKRSNYKMYLEEFQKLYKENGAYQRIVDEFSNMYLCRVSDRDCTLTDQQKEYCSINYLLEETAMFTCLCEENWNVLVYPGSIKSFIDIAEGRFTEVPEALRKIVFISLRLNRGSLYFTDDESGFYPASMAKGNTDFSTYPLLASLSVDELKIFLKYTDFEEFRGGDIILRRGERDRSVLFPLDGSVEILEGDLESKKMKQKAIRGPGTSIGEQSFLDGEAASTTVAAYTDCRLLSLSKKQFEKMLAKEPYLISRLSLDIGRMLSPRQEFVLDGELHFCRVNKDISPATMLHHKR